MHMITKASHYNIGVKFPITNQHIKGIMDDREASVNYFVCAFVLSLVLLVFLNMMLFYKLWMLEYSAQSLTTWQGLRLHERYTINNTKLQRLVN